jgi:flagellar assembly protein FliH
LPELLRVPVTDGVRTLVAPAPVLDPATTAVVEQVASAARAEGFREGEAAGYAAAAATIERATSAILASLQQLHAEVVSQREAACHADLQLATSLAGDVLDRTPPVEALAGLDRVRAVVDRLDDDPLEARLHPDDHAAVVATEAALDGRLRLVADPSVAAGDARVVGTWGGAELTREAMLVAASAARAEGAS